MIPFFQKIRLHQHTHYKSGNYVLFALIEESFVLKSLTGNKPHINY